MKKIISIPIISLLISSLLVQYSKAEYRYKKGDKLNNLAISGLNLRDKPNINSNVITLVPYGKTVEIIDFTDNKLDVDNIKGHWVKVKYKNKIGYIFDGYLSWLPAPEKKLIERKWRGLSLKEYKKMYLKNCGIYQTTKPEDDYNHKATLIIPNITLQEGFLIAKLLILYSRIGEIIFPYNNKIYKTPDNYLEINIKVNKLDKYYNKLIIEIHQLPSSATDRIIIKAIEKNKVKITYYVILP